MPLGEADTYHFSLRFRLPAHQRIYGDDISLILRSSVIGDRLELRSTDNSALKDARQLALFGFGYTDKTAAEAACGRARKAVALTALESSCGVAIRRDDLDVWKGFMANVECGRGGAGVLVVGVAADDFRSRLDKWLAANPTLTNNQSLCINMLLDYHFDLSIRSKSLLAHAAIERLCSDPIRKEEIYVEAIKRLTVALHGISDDPALRAQLAEDLSRLQFHGQTQRCRRAIALRLGEHRAVEYDEVAKERHRIAHHGRSASDQSWHLYRIASDLLFKGLHSRP